jgi:hypothetical protein
MKRIRQKDLTKQQQNVLLKIKQYVGRRTDRYDFWFQCNSWSGGFELPLIRVISGPARCYSIQWTGRTYALYKNFD